MSLQYRRRINAGNGQWINVSTRGVSVSKRVGRVTVNSRQGVRVNLGRGFFWRSR